MAIEVAVQDVRETVDDEVPPSSSFTRWANMAAGAPEEPMELTIRVVDPDESQQLNSQYRGKDRPTNVLSFAYGDELLPEEADTARLLGDLVICAELVQQEAEVKQCLVFDHWAHLTIHGVLHLMGYDHETRQQASDMEALEIGLLASLNIKNPYEAVNE